MEDLQKTKDLEFHVLHLDVSSKLAGSSSVEIEIESKNIETLDNFLLRIEDEAKAN